MKGILILGILLVTFKVEGQPIWSNPITGMNPGAENPYTSGQVVDDNITVSGIGRGPGLTGSSANNRYSASGWSTTIIDDDDYFYFTITPAAGAQISFQSFEYTGQASATGPVEFSFRSSLDGYTSEIGSPLGAGASIDLNAQEFQGVTTEITFRMYAWGSSSTGGTFSINDFSFNGTVETQVGPRIVAEPSSLNGFLSTVTVPSGEMQYTISATNLTDDITITPPEGFGISLTSVTGFVDYPNSMAIGQVSGVVPPTVIYVRLQPGQPGTVQGVTLHESNGAASTEVNLEGRVIANEPAIQGSINVVSASSNSIDLAISPGDGQGRMILAKAGLPVNATPTDGQSFASSSMFGNGDEIATGNFVILTGSTNAVTVTGLTPGVTYHFTLFEYNDEGAAGAENYLIDNPFTTSAATNSSQVSYTWIGGDGDWTEASNWSPARFSSLSTDVLQFNSGANLTITGLMSDEFGRMILSNNTHITFKAAMDAVLNAMGLPGEDDLIVEAGSVLRLGEGAPISIVLGAEATAVAAGNIELEAEPHRIIATDPGSIVFENGSLLDLGTGFSGGVFGSSPGGAVLFESGSTLLQSAGASPFGSSNALIFQEGSLFRYMGTGSPSFNGRTYANVEFALPHQNPITITGSSAVTIHHLTISSGNVNFNMTGQAHTITGDVMILPGASLNLLPANPCVLTMNGASMQTLSNLGGLTSNSNFQLAIDNSYGLAIEGVVSLNNASLKLVNGHVHVGDDWLILNSVTGGDAAKHIKTTGTGSVTLTAIGQAATLFPVGNSGYNPVTVSNGSGLDWSVRVIDDLVVNDPAFSANANRAVHRTWEVLPAQDVPGLNAEISVQYNDGTDVGNLFDPNSDVQGWRKAGTHWVAAGGASTPQGVAGGDRVVTISGLDAFSFFALANVDAPLPVQLVNVKAITEGNAVKISWDNLTEFDVLEYSIQRSTEGAGFATIGQMPSQYNSGEFATYSFIDSNPLAGKNFYRIRTMERYGSENHSAIVLAEIKGDKEDILAYPNPIQPGETLKIAWLPSGEYRVVLYDQMGRIILREKILKTGAGNTELRIPNLPAGVYILELRGSGKKYTRKIKCSEEK